jgi:hypothetical protein
MPCFDCTTVNSNQTLATLRTRLARRLGFSAQATNLPPGAAELFDEFLISAQTFLFMEYPALETRYIFQWRCIQGERFYGLRKNDENWTDVKATISVGSPAVVDFTPGNAPPDGREIYFRVASGGQLPGGIDANVRYFVVNSAGSTCNVAATAGGPPIGTTGTTSGDITATYSPPESCIFDLQVYKNIEGAYVIDEGGTWMPLVNGIKPTFYTSLSQQGLPAFYEIRQCLEIFPAPSSSGYSVAIKGHFGLQPFEADGDQTTIDSELVFLWALANALDYYQKPSAAIWQQAQRYLGQLVAGTHGSRRYIPGKRLPPPAIQPRPVGGWD